MRHASATISGSASVRTDAPARSAAAAALAAPRAGRFRRAGKFLRHHADARRCRGLRQQFGPAGHRRKPLREVLDAGREQSDRVERPRIAFYADRRQQPVGRLDRSHAAERGRPDHRAAGLRPQRQRNHPGADRRRRARRRSARRMAVIVRIERRGRIVRRECRRRGLADDGRARRLQRHHDRRIGAGPPAPVDRRAHFGRKIRRIDDVLDADGDAAQRPVRARAVLVVADKGADGLSCADRLQRLGDRGLGESSPESIRRWSSASEIIGVFLWGWFACHRLLPSFLGAMRKHGADPQARAISTWIPVTATPRGRVAHALLA